MLPLVLLLVVFASPLSAKDTWKNVERVVAIGDLHGDFDQYLLVLADNNLIDSDQNWQGGRTHLVQVGDVVDRGPDSLKIMRHLKKLHKQAKKSKGYVHMMLGNHELMNIKDDLRYVHPGEYKILVTPKSVKKQLAYTKLVFASLLERDPSLIGKESEQMDMLSKQFPLGYVEHRYIWAKKGEFYEWAKQANTVIKIDRTLFTHGGISPHQPLLPIKQINKSVKQILSSDKLPSSSALTGDEGPLWYRGLAFNKAEVELDPLKKMLDFYDADAIVIAHTPTPGTVIPRLDGLVYMIDVGIAKHYGSRRANLVIENGVPHVIHRGTKIALPPRPVHSADLKHYLQQASQLDPQPSPLLKTIKKLENVELE